MVHVGQDRAPEAAGTPVGPRHPSASSPPLAHTSVSRPLTSRCVPHQIVGTCGQKSSARRSRATARSARRSTRMSPTSTANPTPAVSVIGLGMMGTALAAAFLKAGHPVTVWNGSPARTGPLVAQGATPADTAADAVAASPRDPTPTSSTAARGNSSTPTGRRSRRSAARSTSAPTPASPPCTTWHCSPACTG
ncbi:NAD(P)-binding domain-containing protein [Streptomyces sp. S4.7]|uniref:NAD(P)-binding domain-containing protein n=1 Tax=Streptomyces sp. S4.7 TaxID=2705439 RepID=UPI0031BB7638